MAYTPENNPYIPGDPYSYDLAWMVQEVKIAQGVGESAKAARDIAIAKAAEAEASSLDSEAWAVGTKAGDPVTSDDPQYENNSKYWADEAADSASAAQDSAGDAADDAAYAHADMLAAKSYAENIADPVSGLVTSWLTDHITNPSNPPIDTSLSVASSAADAKAAGDAIRANADEIEKLIHEASVTASGTGNYYVVYGITAGHNYRFKVTAGTTTTLATVSALHATIESIGNAAPGTDVVVNFSATQDAPELLFYFRGAGSATVEDLSVRVPVLEAASASYASDIATDQAKIAKLEDDSDMLLYRRVASGNNGSNVYFAYSVEAGKVYKIVNDTGATLTLSTLDGSDNTVDTINVNGSNSGYIVASANAVKIWFYFRATGTAYFFMCNTAQQPWIGRDWSSYGDSISYLYDWHQLTRSILQTNNWIRNGIPGACISWNADTAGIDSNGIYTTGVPDMTIKKSMCSYNRIANTLNPSLPLIFVMGGTNDFLNSVPLGDLTFNAASTTDADWYSANPVGDYNMSTFKGALASMFMKLQYYAPDALIVCGSLLNGIGDTSGVNQYAESVNTASLKPSDYAKAMQEVADVFGIPFIDVFGECGISMTNRATYISDTVHPNSDGQDMLGRCVAAGLTRHIPR